MELFTRPIIDLFRDKKISIKVLIMKYFVY